MIDATKFGAGMALLAGAFSRNLEATLMKVYYAALSKNLTDEEFERAVELCLSEETFWPPPATIIGKVKGIGKQSPPPPTVDSSTILRRIEKLGKYNPSTGMVYPRVDEVRQKMGEEAAYAYASAGAQRCFSDNETTRDICAREFHKVMELAARNPNATLQIIAGFTPDDHLLESGDDIDALPESDDEEI
jgi:ribosomal protein S16